MKFVAMSGNQLRVTLSLYTLYIAMSPEPALYNVATLTASCLDLGSATGRINMKSLGLFLFRLNASWQGLAGGLLLWLMGIPEASDFMSIPWNKNSVPGVNENFLTQITQTSTGAQGVQLDFWTELLVEKIPDAKWTGSDHDEVFTDHSDLIRMTRLASLWTNHELISFHCIEFTNFTLYFTDWHGTETIHSPITISTNFRSSPILYTFSFFLPSFYLFIEMQIVWFGLILFILYQRRGICLHLCE